MVDCFRCGKKLFWSDIELKVNASNKDMICGRCYRKMFKRGED